MNVFFKHVCIYSFVAFAAHLLFNTVTKSTNVSLTITEGFLGSQIFDQTTLYAAQKAMHKYKNNVMKLIYSQRDNFILYFANRRVLNSYYVHFRIMC